MKKFFLLFLYILFNFFLFSNTDYKNYFYDTTDDKAIKDLFSINIGIMNLKKTGKIQQINPLDLANIENAIKNLLEKIPSIKLSKKASITKSLNVYLKRLSTNEKEKIEKTNYLKTKFFFSEELDQNLVYELFLQFREHKDFSKVTRNFFENIGNFNYPLNITSPFERSLATYEKICEEKNLDILISGEIERIDRNYYINLFFYSYLLKSKIAELTFLINPESIDKNIKKEFSPILSKIFSINYASLEIITNDEDIKIFLNNEYIGRKNIEIEYIIPSRYVVTLKKDNFEDKNENILITDFEKKSITLNMEKKEPLQVINFNIEPYGTKIFINSVYHGKTPFKKALPLGNYVIYAKNEFYESYRYLLEINEVNVLEKNVVFHLKSKDPINYFKIKKSLYYTAFWNFTFSLATAVPVTVFANNIFYSYASYASSFTGKDVSASEAKQIKDMETARDALYAASWITLCYTAISLGWLFYALADYIKVLDKKDFIPILEFYNKNLESKKSDAGITLGINIKVKN